MRLTRMQWWHRQHKPAPRHREKHGPGMATKTNYTFGVPGHGKQKATAYTKSEARAHVKKRLGLKRLPVGTVCQ